MKVVLFFLVPFFLIACSTNIPSSARLNWQYNHSTDVAHFKVNRSIPHKVKGKTCGIVWELETVEVFKGSLKPGDYIQVWGPSDPQTWSGESEELMFLRKYDGQGTSECSKHLFKNYKMIHWGCCRITQKNGQQEVIFFRLKNSNEVGEYIPVDSSKVFDKLRSY